MKHVLHNAVARLLPFLMQTRKKQRLSILTYHGVLPDHDFMRPNEPTAAIFDWQMELISHYFNPLPLSEALALMRVGELPERAVCITFDDGYANNAEQALPILQRWRIPATVFVSTGFLNGGRMWNDSVIEALRIAEGLDFDLRELGLDVYYIEGIERRRASAAAIISEIKHWPPQKRAHAIDVIEARVGLLPGDMMMTDDQVRLLNNAGIEIGAHTQSHPILATLDRVNAEQEILGSKFYLESLLGRPVRHFAYPNGRPGIDYRMEHRDLVEQGGFESAVSTQWGVANPVSDRWQLPRFTPWDRTPLRFMTRLLLNYRHPG
ncbi:MAG: polysaccharide deacetylase family protein [Porticoccaceae bacterium]